MEQRGRENRTGEKTTERAGGAARTKKTTRQKCRNPTDKQKRRVTTHPRPLLADVVEQRLHLRVEHVPQVAPLALVQRLPHARDHAQAHVQRVARLLADALVRLAAAFCFCFLCLVGVVVVFFRCLGVVLLLLVLRSGFCP